MRESGLIREGEGEEEVVRCAQQDFRPSPYNKTEWETVGERWPHRDFLPLEISVVGDDRLTPDPMFAVFDEGLTGKGVDLIGHGGLAPHSKSVVESDEPRAPTEEEIRALEELLEQKFAEGKQAGYQEGYREGELSVAERYEKLSARVSEITNGISAQVQGLLNRLQVEAVELSLQISRKILATTVEVRPDYIVDVIREALKSLGAAKPLRVRVSPQDYEFLEVVGLPPELSTQELGVVYVIDESVRSGCIVETDFGEVDMILDKMWEQVKDSIYEAVK